MKDALKFTLTVIGLASQICYLEKFHTGDSGETIPLASVVNSPESFIAKTMRVTAYCPCSKCCNSWATKGVNSKGQRITASGHVIRPGDRFCAAPKSIPFGTMIDIPGYGRVPVLDRGGAIKDGKIDVFFGDSGGKTGHQLALEWGVRNVVVTIIGSKP